MLKCIVFWWSLFTAVAGAALPARAQLTSTELTVGWADQFGLNHLMAIPIYLQNPAFHWNKTILSLREGMQKGSVKVTERGGMDFENIRWIRVSNNSDQPVLLLSGEILKGGRQDRMIAMDTLLMPSEKDQYVPVVCLEEGRWSKKELPFSYQGMANTELRLMLAKRAKQAKIWNEISFQIDRTKTKSKTRAYTAIRKQKENAVAIQQYMQYFEKRMDKLASNTNGLIFLSANKILGVELFASAELMREYQESFLISYIESAVIHGGKVRISKDTVELYLKNMLRDEQWQSYFLNSNLGRSYKIESKPIYMTGYQYEAMKPEEKP